HELLFAQLLGHGSEDACTLHLSCGIEQHHGVVIEADVATVLTAGLLLGAYDHGLMHGALFGATVGHCGLDAYHDRIADACITACGTTQHTDAKHFLGTAIVGHVQPGFLLDHRFGCFYLARSTTSTRRQRFCLLIGRVSMMRTVSPIWASSFSSCAMNLLESFTNFPYFGCITRRSTITTTLLFILSLVTTPTRSFLRLRSMVDVPYLLCSLSSRFRSSVRMRATSLRLLRSCIGFSTGLTVWLKRSFVSPDRSSCSLSCSSWTVRSFNSNPFFFMALIYWPS